MDIAKILENLQALAQSTNFKSERENCIQKIKLLRLKYPNATLSSRETNSENTVFIEELRKIALEALYPYFIDGNVVLSENCVPVHMNCFFLDFLKSRADETIQNFPTNKKLYKYYKELISWARDQKESYKSRKSFDYFSDRYYYIFLDKETAYFMDYSRDGMQPFLERAFKCFEDDKKFFLERLNEGYWDSEIRNLFDPKLLEIQNECY